ncbi:Short-chain dehydrogenase/reductase SDR [Sesbania bispinosa]|nr:Short-chain dehydrogenase/reductase SDR [Sesbania bispinosa]
MASSASSSSRGIAAIVGVGPKLGRSIARKFAHEGYTVAILARRLSRLAEEIAREEKAQVFAIRIDCSDSKSVRDAFEGVLSLGFVEVLVYNAYEPLSPTSFQHLRVETFQKSIAVSTVGAFHCAQQVMPGMVERGKGTILFTGCSASLNGFPGYSQLCCGKFALRALAQCLAREFQPQGVHIAHVIMDGVVGPPRRKTTSVGEQSSGEGDEGTMDPDALAQTYWHLHVQDRTAWTQELDLRSSNARFF